MDKESKSLGEILKEERIKRGLDLKEISEKLKISYRYLKYLEDDQYDRVNLSDFYKKGILKKYAKFLALDEKEILKLYYSQYKSEEMPIKPTTSRSQKSLWKYGVYLVVFLIILITLYLSVNITNHPKTSQNLVNTYTYEEYYSTPTLKDTTIYTESIESSISEDLLSYPSIKVLAHDRVWIRVINNDNKILYEGILNNGDSITWTYSLLYFHIGNAGGLEIFYNNKSLGILGKKGEVIKIKVP